MPLKPAAAPATNGENAAPEGRERLLERLLDAAAETRRSAARALAGDPAMVAALVARVGEEPELTVREAILTSLLQTGGDEALTRLLGFIRAENPRLRNEVFDVLAEFPGDRLRTHVERLLADADPHKRIAAVRMIQALANPAAGELLAAVLEREEHVNVAAAAVELIGEMGCANAAESLRRARSRFAAVPFMRFAIETALARVAGAP